MASEAQRTLDRVCAPLAAVLKANGFRKSGRTFFRHGDDFADVLNVQASQWNTSHSMSFTVNVGAHQSELAAQLRCQRGTLPQRVELCMLGARIGSLMPAGLDHWWEVAPETSEEDVAQSLLEAVERWVFPWFLACRRKDTLVRYLASRAGVAVADRLLLLNERDSAVQVAEREQSCNREEAIARWKADHGIGGH